MEQSALVHNPGSDNSVGSGGLFRVRRGDVRARRLHSDVGFATTAITACHLRLRNGNDHCRIVGRAGTQARHDRVAETLRTIDPDLRFGAPSGRAQFARLLYIGGNLFPERLDAFEFFLRPEELHKFDLDISAINVAMEIEEMHFDHALSFFA